MSFKDELWEELERSKNLAQWLSSLSLASKDAWKLEQKDWHLLFVYDTLMEGQKHNELLRHSSVPLTKMLALKYGILTAEFFSAFKHKESGVGFILKKDYHNVPRRRVRGEWYLVKTQTLLELDQFRQNLYTREYLTTVVSYIDPNVKDSQGSMATFKKAWVYVGNLDYWDDQLDEGYEYSPFPTHSDEDFVISNLRNYYYFT